LDLVAAHGDAVVAGRLELEVETENEVAVLLHREQIAAALFEANEIALLRDIALGRALPALQRLAVEQADEALILFFFGETLGMSVTLTEAYEGQRAHTRTERELSHRSLLEIPH